MAFLTIGGVVQKTPKTFKVGIQDIDGETARNARGELMRDRITTKRKIDMDFPPMTQTEMAKILNAVSAVFFSVLYQDPILGMTTKTFYVGDRTTPMMKFGNGTTELLWESVAFNLIEK